MVHVMQIRQKIHWNEVNIMAPDPDHGGLVEKAKTWASAISLIPPIH